MAWNMHIDGMMVPIAVPDVMVQALKEHIKANDPPTRSMWIELGEAGAEGSVQVRIPPGAALLFVRAPNDPAEAEYNLDWRLNNTD